MSPETQQHEIDESVIHAFSFLLTAYDCSSDYREQSVPIWDIGKAVGLSELQAEEIASELQELNLLYYSSLAGDIALTSFGMSEVVLAQSQPQLATTHFPPLANMSAQMLLPLRPAQQPQVSKLVHQLESYGESLTQLADNRHDLNESVQMLEEVLATCDLVESSFIAELEEINEILR